MPNPRRQSSTDNESAPSATPTATSTTTETVASGNTSTPPSTLPLSPVEPQPPIRGLSSKPLPEFDPELVSRLKTITPEQRARIRGGAVAAGIIGAGAGRPLPDGSIQVLVTVNSDNVEQIKVWAEEAGKSFEEQVRELFDYLLSSYLHGEWAMAGGQGQGTTQTAPAKT